MSDMLPMQYALQFHPREGGLKVYAPETPANVQALLNAPCYDLNVLQDVQIGEISFRFTPVRHPVECYALRAQCDGKTFVYTGDTNTLPGLEVFLQDADVLLADAGLSMEHWSEKAPHLSARHCAELARDSGAKQLLLTHLNPRYTPEQLEGEAREIRPDARFVRIGESYTI
jgi:ribonuclease BN (tRNA processing enzyme)